jgi:predicted MPP superfamily phosphohydrolase
VLRVGSAKLQIFGVDDPIRHGPTANYYRDALTRLAATAEPDAFRLLLCHRPQGFASARELGFHLTLAGHTHGGQLGLLGKSAFEVILGHRHQWGLYRENERVLYTSSGFGHWFPFRLHCPTELPIITLRRG